VGGGSNRLHFFRTQFTGTWDEPVRRRKWRLPAESTFLFADGNGRIGRLWQTLILSRWKPALAWLPVESVIQKRQKEYYRALAAVDKAGHSTVFIEFILSALLQALREISPSDQVRDQVTNQVKALLKCLGTRALSAAECMKKLHLTHRPTFRRNYLQPALNAGLIERTVPDKPNSRLQKYRRKVAGREQAHLPDCAPSSGIALIRPLPNPCRFDCQQR
jgi:hypothetical protein